MILNIRNDLFYSDQEIRWSKNIHEYPVVSVTKKDGQAKSVNDIFNKQKPSKAHRKNECIRKSVCVPAHKNENQQDKRFSNDMRDACKTICQICKASVFLATMRGHTRRWHKVPIEEYKRVYGNHRDMITEKVYHKCGICFATVLLDSDDISHHVKKHHSITHKTYNAEFMATKISEKEETMNKSKVLHVREDDLAPKTNLDLDDELMRLQEEEILSNLFLAKFG